MVSKLSTELDLPEDFVFLTFANAILRSLPADPSLNASNPQLSNFNGITGLLGLKCISRALVLTINSSETPVDPVRTVSRSEIISTPTGSQYDTKIPPTPTKKIVYRFLGTPYDPTELELTIDFPLDPDVHSALEMFDNILAQYVVDFKRITAVPSSSPLSSSSQKLEQNQDQVFASDLRNQIILVNEETGQVLGRIEDDTSRVIQKDSSMPQAADQDTLQGFTRVVPPHQETWITNSATVVSDAISMSTDLLLRTVTAASSYYINHSSPSSYHSSLGTPGPGTSVSSSDAIGTAPSSTTIAIQDPSPSSSEALAFFTSSKTRQGLSIAHAISTGAVAASSKTVALVDGMIQQVMETRTSQPMPASSQSVSRMPSLAAPACPLPGTLMLLSTPPEAQRPVQISTTDSVLISADLIFTSAGLIFSTLNNSTQRALKVGAEEFGRIVNHKYGPEAAHSSLMLAGTARNIGLFFVDVSGVGRRVLVRSGTGFVKARILDMHQRQLPPLPN